MGPRIKIEGSVFGELTVVRLYGITNNGHTRYTCLCSCGTEKTVLGTHLVSGKTKSCGCKMYKKGKDHPDWGGYEEISGNWWHSHVIRSCNGSSKTRIPKELGITMKYAWDLFVKQGRKCALSGVKITIGSAGTASIDRIDSSLGYIEGNIQWVHKHVNRMKSNYTNDYFIDVCRQIANFTKPKKG